MPKSGSLEKPSGIESTLDGKFYQDAGGYGRKEIPLVSQVEIVNVLGHTVHFSRAVEYEI